MLDMIVFIKHNFIIHFRKKFVNIILTDPIFSIICFKTDSSFEPQFGYDRIRKLTSGFDQIMVT